MLCRTVPVLKGVFNASRLIRPYESRTENNFRSDLLVPAPQFQNRVIRPDDRLAWREVGRSHERMKLHTMVLEVTEFPFEIVTALIERKEVLVTDRFGKTKTPNGLYELHIGDSVGIPKVLPEHLWRKLEGKERKKKPLSAQEIRMVRSWVVFQNDECIVINKPPAVPCTPGKGTGISVFDLLPGLRYTKNQDPVFVSLLEKDVSGCVVLARSSDARRHLQKHLREVRVPTFAYWGIISHKPKTTQGKVNMHLELHRGGGGDRTLVRAEATKLSQPCKMEFNVVSPSSHGVAWASFYPIKHARHDIRIASSVVLKAPIVGDTMYGGDAAMPYGELDRLMGKFENQLPLMLHCRQVSLPYESLTSSRKVVAAELPDHMKSIFTFMMWDEKHRDPFLHSGAALDAPGETRR